MISNKYATLLKQNDFKVTRRRLKMLESLEKGMKPMSAQEVFLGMTEVKVDLATVYRSLNRFADAGIILRVQLGDDFTRFEFLNPQDRHHHHIVCNLCGKVKEIEMCNLNDISSDIAQKTGFRNIGHQVVFRGECGDCAITQ